MRWALVTLLLVGSTAWAQSTGGSFGGGSFEDDDDDDSASSYSGSGSSGGGSSDDATSDDSTSDWPSSSHSSSSSDSTFPSATPHEPPDTYREPTPEERAREAERRAQQEAERIAEKVREQKWIAAHRQAGTVLLKREEWEAFEPPSLFQKFFWPHGLLALLAFVLVSAGPSLLTPGTGALKRLFSTARQLFSTAHIIQVSVAFDWDARAALQKQLSALARSANLSSPAQRQHVLDKVISKLERILNEARYASWQVRVARRASAQERFNQMAAKLRGRYSKELVRNERQEEAGDVRARAREGKGLVVVSLLVGRTGLPSLPPRKVSSDTLQALLEKLTWGDSVHMLEVIWSPAADADRMSSAELEVLYPELVRLDEEALGRVACPSCQALYAAELGSCPSCGDTAEGTGAKHVLAGPCPHCQADMPRYETKCENCGAWVPADGKASPD